MEVGKEGRLMDIAQKLRSEGYKVTPQRLAIYQAVLNDHNLPNAESIYNSLKASHPTMSLATVYKTMEIFAKINVVRILNVGDDSHRYDYDVHTHPHIRCSECNKVIDLHGVDMGKLKDVVHEVSDFYVTKQELSFEGICPSCQKKLKQFEKKQ